MKTILITGASKGIGKAIAIYFAKNGYDVAINYNKSKSDAEDAYNEIIKLGRNALIYKANISNPNEVKNMIDFVIKSWGHIDVVVNNAGISNKQLLIDENDTDTLNIISTNLLGAIYISKYAIPYMLKSQKGKIINISSIWGKVGASMETTYSSSKAGLIGLTKSLAKEYGYNNIQVNCICPGLIYTQMNNNLSKKELDDLIKSIPAQRMGNREEIAKLCFDLVNQDYITGQIITIDGGLTL